MLVEITAFHAPLVVQSPIQVLAGPPSLLHTLELHQHPSQLSHNRGNEIIDLHHLLFNLLPIRLLLLLLRLLIILLLGLVLVLVLLVPLLGDFEETVVLLPDHDAVCYKVQLGGVEDLPLNKPLGVDADKVVGPWDVDTDHTPELLALLLHILVNILVLLLNQHVVRL